MTDEIVLIGVFGYCEPCDVYHADGNVCGQPGWEPSPEYPCRECFEGTCDLTCLPF